MTGRKVPKKGRHADQAATRLPPGFKKFRPISWYESASGSSTFDYLSHILRELGRLGLETHDIERHDRPPNTRTVLSDLLDWLETPNEALARMFEWQKLNIELLRSRSGEGPPVKPRIQVSAEVSDKNNLSVRWHPSDFRNAYFVVGGKYGHHPNKILQLKWPSPPDFVWFTGDEPSTFQGRASNELMYIRGVGNLEPAPRSEYGVYATHNHDVVDSILICAVRAAYEGLIRQLKLNFEIEVLQEFDFEVREEVDEDRLLFPFHLRRVVSWKLLDAKELASIRQDQQERREREELAAIHETFRFNVDVLVGAIRGALSKKKSGPPPTGRYVNENAAKMLRNAGYKIHAGQVNRVRQLLKLIRIPFPISALSRRWFDSECCASDAERLGPRST